MNIKYYKSDNGNQMEGQMSISDYQFVINNGYNNYHEHCSHRGWLKPATDTEPSMWMCSYAKGHPATGWDDWEPCTSENCPLLRRDNNG